MIYGFQKYTTYPHLSELNATEMKTNANFVKPIEGSIHPKNDFKSIKYDQLSDTPADLLSSFDAIDLLYDKQVA